jgi:hypothetical protein
MSGPAHLGILSAMARPMQSHLITFAAMDRRLARKNIRTGLVAGAVSVLVFGASWVAAWLY